MKKQPTIYRQGDVLLELVAEIPVGAKDVTPSDRIVLAHGEVTGHAHAVYPEATNSRPCPHCAHVVNDDDCEHCGEVAIPYTAEKKMPAKMWDAGAERFLQVVTPTALKHEEHAPIALPPGVYRVKQQREYSPEAIRNVQD